MLYYTLSTVFFSVIIFLSQHASSRVIVPRDRWYYEPDLVHLAGRELPPKPTLKRTYTSPDFISVGMTGDETRSRLSQAPTTPAKGTTVNGQRRPPLTRTTSTRKFVSPGMTGLNTIGAPAAAPPTLANVPPRKVEPGKQAASPEPARENTQDTPNSGSQGDKKTDTVSQTGSKGGEIPPAPAENALRQAEPAQKVASPEPARKNTQGMPGDERGGTASQTRSKEEKDATEETHKARKIKRQFIEWFCETTKGTPIGTLLCEKTNNTASQPPSGTGGAGRDPNKPPTLLERLLERHRDDPILLGDKTRFDRIMDKVKNFFSTKDQAAFRKIGGDKNPNTLPILKRKIRKYLETTSGVDPVKATRERWINERARIENARNEQTAIRAYNKLYIYNDRMKYARDIANLIHYIFGALRAFTGGII